MEITCYRVTAWLRMNLECYWTLTFMTMSLNIEHRTSKCDLRLPLLQIIRNYLVNIFLKRTISEKGNNYKIYPLPVNNIYTSKMLYSWKSVRTSSSLSKNKSRKRNREKQQIKTKTNKRSVHTHTWRSRESKPEDHIERIWSINMIKNVSVKNVKM